MGDKIPVISEKKYTFDGIFNLKATYGHLADYFENSMFYDTGEKDFAEKNMGTDREIMSKIEGEKLYNDTFKTIIKLEMNMKGKDIEVEVNDKKTILTKGTAKITINAYIEPDWQATRGRTALTEFFGKIYDKFVGTDDQKLCMDDAAKDVGMLIARFKEHMNATIK